MFGCRSDPQNTRRPGSVPGAAVGKEVDEVSMYYMSFADPNLHNGTQFLGAVIVEAASETLAHMSASTMGLNPGGTGTIMNRLLSRGDIHLGS